MTPEKPLAFIIEDDEDLSIIFSEALNAAGFQTQMIRDGRLALEQLMESKPKVVILDMHLPGLSGLEILKYIRTDERLALTNVVVTTADAVMAEQVRDIADLALIKPITFGQLRDLSARLNRVSSTEK